MGTRFQDDPEHPMKKDRFDTLMCLTSIVDMINAVEFDPGPSLTRREYVMGLITRGKIMYTSAETPELARTEGNAYQMIQNLVIAAPEWLNENGIISSCVTAKATIALIADSNNLLYPEN